MSRRGGANHPDPRRNQPSPAISQSSVNAAGSGRGGRGSRGGHTVPSPSSVPSPVPVTAASSTAAPVVAGSTSAPTRPSPALASATVSTEVLSSEVEKLTLESTPAAASAPSSQKAVRFPNRPGIGRLGRKIQVRANHFQLQVVDKDLHHYDVSFAPEITSKKVSRDVINQLVKMHQESMLGNRIPAYDGRKSLYTAGPLPFTSKVFVINLVDENKGSSSGSDTKKREREFKVTIKFASQTDLNHLTQFLRRLQLDCPYETIQALDIACGQLHLKCILFQGGHFSLPVWGHRGLLAVGLSIGEVIIKALGPHRWDCPSILMFLRGLFMNRFV